MPADKENKTAAISYTYGLVTLLLISLLLTSCAALQYGTNYSATSKFSGINASGMSKADFISKYGQPATILKGADTAQGVEKMYYIEQLATSTITTEFTFKNGVFKDSRLFSVGENFQRYKDSLDWQIRMSAP